MARGAHREAHGLERRRGARALLLDEPQGRIYERAIGTDTFEGNDATRWGTENEPNALVAYSAHTGNLVEPTGLHVHKHADWLAGSPDGLIGTEGIVEAKCPYWSKTNQI